MVFEIGFLSGLFVVFIKPYFKNHEKTMKKKPSTARKPTKKAKKKIQFLSNEYKISAI